MRIPEKARKRRANLLQDIRTLQSTGIGTPGIRRSRNAPRSICDIPKTKPIYTWHEMVNLAKSLMTRTTLHTFPTSTPEEREQQIIWELILGILEILEPQHVQSLAELHHRLELITQKVDKAQRNLIEIQKGQETARMIEAFHNKKGS
ncbi:MAG TPA: hypothetical protein VJJ80_00065 [Patescibacteria group bacterium]|nr:hypothetical protein [Patescibacteria group bacterium]